MAFDQINRRPLLRSKLQIPPPRPTLVSRPRLTQRLQRCFAYKLTLISAPAGYGKTTLLAAFAAQQDVPVIWYALDDDDNDLTVFFAYLVAGLEAHCPGLRASVRALLEDPGAIAQPTWIATVMLNRLEQMAGPLLIILDNYHAITSEAIHSTLAFLLSHLPSHISLLIGTRVDPPLSLASLQAQDQLLTIRAEELRFTLEEVLRFGQKSLADANAQGAFDARALEKKTAGWAVGLQLAITSLRQQPPDARADFIHRFSGTTRLVFSYLADEVYAKQPPDLRTFLLHTSILSELFPDLCDAVLGIERSHAMLAQLVRMNLFIRPLDLSHETFRYYELFRDFLRRRLRENESQETIRHLHQRAAAWFLEQRDDEQAIEHLLVAGDYDAAADLFRSLQAHLFRTSRHHLLARWLNQFPPAIVASHPWVMLTRARLASLRGSYAQADRLSRQAEPLLQAQQDQDGLYNLYETRAKSIRDQGDFAEAEVLYRQALSYAATDIQRAMTLGQIARCSYMQGGAVEEALHLLDEAMARAKRSGHLPDRARLLSLKGRMLSSLGDFTGALEAWHTTLELREAYGNRHRQIGVLTNTAYLHCLLGEFDEAAPLVQRARKLARVFGRETHRSSALKIQGMIDQARGEWTRARRCYEEALAIQRQFDERYEIPVTLNHWARLERQAGRLDEALRLGEEGLALREALGNDYETGLSLIEMGAIHLALGHRDRAGAMWRRALDIFTRHAARYEQAQLHFYLAVLAQRRQAAGKEEADEVATHLEKAITLARTYERGDPPRSLHFFIADAEWTAPLMAYTLRADLVPDCVDCLLPRLGEPALRVLLPLLDDVSPDVRARAAHLMGRLGDAAALQPLYAHRKDADPGVRRAIEAAQEALLSTPPPPLRIQTLGRFRLWRGEREITDWPRRSARDVFLLLLLHHPQSVAADVLAEALWPGSTPEKASQSLRRAISDLRHTLEPELPPRSSSRYLVVASETYTLKLPPGSYMDDVIFEDKLAQALDMASLAMDMDTERANERQRAITALASALDHYAGDYLAELPFEEWTLARRERLRYQWLRGARRLAQLRLEAEKFEAAIATAHRVLTQEPWDEAATQILMRAHVTLDDIPAALRAYETLRDRLSKDLDIPPREDLTALYNRLREKRM